MTLPSLCNARHSSLRMAKVELRDTAGRTVCTRFVMEATTPTKDRMSAPRSCQQVFAERASGAQRIHGSVAFISGLKGGRRRALIR
jgi:hypothetical protein